MKNMKTKIRVYRLDGQVDVYETEVNKSNFQDKITGIMYEMFPYGNRFYGVCVVVDGKQIGSDEMPSFPIKKIDIICLKAMFLSSEEIEMIADNRNEPRLPVY